MTNQQEKDTFLVFTRLLMKYLEQTDPKMHADAKQVLKGCRSRSAQGCDATTATTTTNVTELMRRGLRDLVGEHIWSKLTEDVAHFNQEVIVRRGILEQERLDQQQQQQQQYEQQRQRQRDLQAQKRRFINSKEACIFYS